VNADRHLPCVTREAAWLLSGYLCGTHSGLHARGRGGSAHEIAARHRSLQRQETNSPSLTLGVEKWQPAGDERSLAWELRNVLASDDVVDLILYGSQARGGLTGFSDVDAILVLEDAAASDAAALRSLRPLVLAAQRAVLAYQPMQHHGFDVATTTLLYSTNDALALPPPALAATSSLNGTVVHAAFSDERRESAFRRLASLALAVQRPTKWPSHPWRAHGLVAMFELLPVVYLQACGVSVSKASSFEQARTEFGAAWWPYDTLAEVRSSWPRCRRPGLEMTSAALRNPWDAVAVWRRLPASVPRRVAELLSDRCLAALQALTRSMVERAT
jgi:hypothetical protein